jgi:2-keto-4-pentenoate hydratase/2-oxohepta-3-ene-1,7-dioic acid hydratase in catechol pathway
VQDWRGSALDAAALAELSGRFARDAQRLPMVDLHHERLGSPVLPGQLISIGLNYRQHALEAGMELPSEPLISNKSPWAVVGPHDDLVIPPRAEKTDWEVELAVVIGRRAQYLASPEASWTHIAGYCTANDVSERSWLLERGGQWVKGKSFPTFAPLGPYLVTRDEVPDPGQLTVTCHVNGKQMQSGSTADMNFDVPYLIYYISQFMVLEPGDVVSTGSPAGIALGRPDTPYLRHGDVVEVEVQGLGAQRQRCQNYEPTGHPHGLA